MYSVTRLKLLILSGLLSCSPFISPTAVGLANGTEDVPSQNAGQMSREYPSSKSKCSSAQIKKYVSKLGTSALTDDQFEALVKCDSQAVSLLKTALNNSSSVMRASAAYALGEIAVKEHSRVAFQVLQEHAGIETDPDTLSIINSYSEAPPDPLARAGTSYRREIQAKTHPSSAVICSLSGIRRIFPRCK